MITRVEWVQTCLWQKEHNPDDEEGLSLQREVLFCSVSHSDRALIIKIDGMYKKITFSICSVYSSLECLTIRYESWLFCRKKKQNSYMYKLKLATVQWMCAHVITVRFDTKFIGKSKLDIQQWEISNYSTLFFESSRLNAESELHIFCVACNFPFIIFHRQFFIFHGHSRYRVGPMSSAKHSCPVSFRPLFSMCCAGPSTANGVNCKLKSVDEVASNWKKTSIHCRPICALQMKFHSSSWARAAIQCNNEAYECPLLLIFAPLTSKSRRET